MRWIGVCKDRYSFSFVRAAGGGVVWLFTAWHAVKTLKVL